MGSLRKKQVRKLEAFEKWYQLIFHLKIVINGKHLLLSSLENQFKLLVNSNVVQGHNIIFMYCTHNNAWSDNHYACHLVFQILMNVAIINRISNPQKYTVTNNGHHAFKRNLIFGLHHNAWTDNIAYHYVHLDDNHMSAIFPIGL